MLRCFAEGHIRQTRQLHVFIQAYRLGCDSGRVAGSTRTVIGYLTSSLKMETMFTSDILRTGWRFISRGDARKKRSGSIVFVFLPLCTVAKISWDVRMLQFFAAGHIRQTRPLHLAHRMVRCVSKFFFTVGPLTGVGGAQILYATGHVCIGRSLVPVGDRQQARAVWYMTRQCTVPTNG